jgi:EAL domain-containing protein (putative c-di-GMP-specific phosphodiesterase class I)/DNA-binding NarL/FixJ family response regulator
VSSTNHLVAKRHVVVLDDDPIMLKMLTHMLARLGMKRVTASDKGARVLQLAADASNQVEVILLDINMPDMDGIEFVRQLAAMRYRGGLILVSGESRRTVESMERLVQSHQLLLLGVLSKPPSPRDLGHMLASRAESSAAGTDAPASAAAPTVAQLLSALNAGQIIPYYQPQVSLQTGEIVGFECLARWERAPGQVIGPNLFIPLAEEHNLIGRITQVILRSAVRQSRDWSRRGLNLRLAINVSMQDISALELPDMLSAVLAEADVAPPSISLEVTESRVMRHLATVLEVLTRLRLRRFHLAIDDFGTGHSSLVQLRDLPFDELKIDRSFVHGARSNSTQRAICQATVQMAQKLGMDIVAEGIEDQEDQDTMTSLGCQYGQGYHFSKPLPPAALPQWLEKHSAMIVRVRRSGR